MKKSDVDALVVAAAGRTKKLVMKLRHAMASIESDIEANEWIYPYNKGRVTQAEVCRRAGTRAAVLQGPVHKEKMLVEVNQWVASIQRKLITGHTSVRQAVTKRADDWKQLYAAAAHHSNLYHLQMVTLRSQLKECERRIKTLESENLQLQVKVSEGRVVHISNSKRSPD